MVKQQRGQGQESGTNSPRSGYLRERREDQLYPLMFLISAQNIYFYYLYAWIATIFTFVFGLSDCQDVFGFCWCFWTQWLPGCLWIFLMFLDKVIAKMSLDFADVTGCPWASCRMQTLCSAKWLKNIWELLKSPGMLENMTLCKHSKCVFEIKLVSGLTNTFYISSQFPDLFRFIITSLGWSIFLCFYRHPDKNDDPDATDKFTKINEAYEVIASRSSNSSSRSNSRISSYYPSPKGVGLW